ncbi:MAG TPA: hypothetical protein VEW93_10375 [Acidimicrobiales bacterium]|nr:hypothetical protein [Acidimicrobiales bacterium]
MTAPTPPSPAGPDRTGPATDWPAQATDAIVGLVDSVKDRTTGPATTLARGLVYGTLATLVGTAALVLAVVLLVRAIDVGVDALLDLADIDDPGRSTWIAHAVTGLLFLVPGLALWRRGTRAAAAD